MKKIQAVYNAALQGAVSVSSELGHAVGNFVGTAESYVNRVKEDVRDVRRIMALEPRVEFQLEEIAESAAIMLVCGAYAVSTRSKLRSPVVWTMHAVSGTVAAISGLRLFAHAYTLWLMNRDGYVVPQSDTGLGTQVDPTDPDKR